MSRALLLRELSPPCSHNSICTPLLKSKLRPHPILVIDHPTDADKMPQSRELTNKKNDHKDRQSRGRAGSTPTDTKKGALALMDVVVDCVN